MAQTKTVKEPFMHIVKRDKMPLWKSILIRAIIVVIALAVTGLVIFFMTRISPANLYSSMIRGSFGNKRKRLRTIKLMTALLCLAIGLAPAFKMKFWNIGAQGQMLVGALAASSLAIKFTNLQSAALLPLMCISAVVAGAIWGVIPAVFKAFWNTNETLFTLMMNYIATFLVMYQIDKWKGVSSGLPSFKQISKNAVMPKLLGEEFLLCTLLVLILTALMYVYMRRTKHGYEIAVVGESENTARYAGINVRKVIIRTMIMSGAICGFCGFLTASGMDFTISENMNSGYGFTAIVVAWLAKFNPVGMIGSSFIMVFFQNAATEISNANSNATTYLSSVIAGVILFFVLGSEFFVNYKMVFRKKAEKEANV